MAEIVPISFCEGDTPEIARENGIEIVPLLEKKSSISRLFGRDLEYSRFDSDNPATTFADVVAARKRM
jgi:hypothetical protein